MSENFFVFKLNSEHSVHRLESHFGKKNNKGRQKKGKDSGAGMPHCPVVFGAVRGDAGWFGYAWNPVSPSVSYAASILSRVESALGALEHFKGARKPGTLLKLVSTRMSARYLLPTAVRNPGVRCAPVRGYSPIFKRGRGKGTPGVRTL